MGRKYFLKEDWCVVWYDQDTGALNADWNGFVTHDQLKIACKKMLSFTKANSIKLHCSNQLSIKVLSKESQNYLSLKWLPSMEKAGIEKMAILIPFDPYARVCLDRTNVRFSGKGKLELFTFGLEKEYLNWLKVSQVDLLTDNKLVNKITAFQLLKVDEEVKKLDPLNIDKDLETIINLNNQREVHGLVGLFYTKLPTPKEIAEYDMYTALAAMRDTGIFLGSIKRLGVEPVMAIPELEFMLEELGKKTNLPPRDTLLHYTVWNPDGDRMRKYSDTEDEKYLINSVKQAFPALEAAIDQLIKLHHLPLESLFFEQICTQAIQKFRQVVEAMVLAYKKVSPGVFARHLRFFFDPITIDGREYIGPGAVELPMFVYDHLLWSSKVTEATYQEFKTTYLPYNLNFMRDIYEHYDKKNSLLDKALLVLKNQNVNDQSFNSAKELLKLCQMQKSFRKPHKKIADKAYKHQERTGKNVGSGGYSTDILRYIIKLNEKKVDSLRTRINELSKTFV